MERSATLLGIVAIILWSMSIALTRGLTEVLGPFGAGAAIYSVSGMLVWLVAGKPQVRGQHPAYLLGCGTLFVIYMVAFVIAIGMANNRQQTLEIGLINYLWPSLTLLFAVVLLKMRARWWLWPGAAIALFGVIWVVSGGNGLDISILKTNISSNPLAYGLALVAAFSWAIYSNLVRLYSRGRGALPLFLLVCALCLWLLFFTLTPGPLHFTPQAVMELLMMGTSTALAYLCWDSAMKKGNATLVAALSYFTPLLSILIASLWLSTPPSATFLPGVGMVVTGSLLCWSASRKSASSPSE
ncbi:aromatic amino acid transporter [Yersinia ruckeri]|uniref:aromatic amino acid DMT transporter YddG n=1 Tax=Yersinia ruckeri TaxID=29486 RepID=UPI0004E333D4|nr:aromatic amino acid DMT transporter YddG [Yersinia ruckeri]ARZ02234.1 Aromatic amino acid exporter YddG [Yersinia ruckeri]ELI6452284.1 aromatic amino acid DMT transporter YddG [Yersinia ruckeri]KFE37612.1 aromatic amino acid exporter [Yersinia ruckeri]MCW6524580.1 aromatic amino acid DMT transporter YddG [Yersinia ruckeri]MCW6528230.1 aromatic amino acid DMT transporter YddG [Yersinia ruckeri]